MNAARLSKSDRLRRVASLLKKARKPLSTMDIIHMANVAAVSAIVSELRVNGMEIYCNRIGDVWYYRMVK